LLHTVAAVTNRPHINQLVRDDGGLLKQ